MFYTVQNPVSLIYKILISFNSFPVSAKSSSSPLFLLLLSNYSEDLLDLIYYYFQGLFSFTNIDEYPCQEVLNWDTVKMVTDNQIPYYFNLSMDDEGAMNDVENNII